MIAGIALVGVVTASIASWLIEQIRETEADQEDETRAAFEQVSRELAELKALVRGQATTGTLGLGDSTA
jgi:voltage-gated potassium channel